MAWEWSHAPEAYETAEKNLRKKPIRWLAECYAEWICYHSDEEINPFPDGTFAQAMREARKINKDTLADYVWREAVELRTCDTGGGALWVCPYGCHTVDC